MSNVLLARAYGRSIQSQIQELLSSKDPGDIERLVHSINSQIEATRLVARKVLNATSQVVVSPAQAEEMRTLTLPLELIQSVGYSFSEDIGQIARELEKEFTQLKKDYDLWEKAKATLEEDLNNLQFCENIRFCGPPIPPILFPGINIPAPNKLSHDPNDLIGPSGYSAQGFIRPAGVWPYMIDFENVGSTSAQTVTVTQQLDMGLDWSTFQLGSFGFGTVDVAVPSGLTQYKTTVSYHNSEGTDLNVIVALDFNVDTGLLTASFTSIDPNTGLAPDGVFDGFLYPEDGSGNGEGFVDYSIQPRSDLASGVTINQQASIIFDTNAAIDTPVAVNTIDADAPVTGIVLAPQSSRTPMFPVTWAGDDQAGAGLDSFTVYVSTDGGSLVPWLTDTVDTFGTFTGALGHAYGFAAVARDFVGNEQAVPADPQAIVRVGLSPTALDDAFAVRDGKTLSGSVMTNDLRGRLKLTAQLVAPPTQGGTFLLNANGSFKYTPPAGFTGQDFFTYKLVSSTGVESNVARVDLATYLGRLSQDQGQCVREEEGRGREHHGHADRRFDRQSDGPDHADLHGRPVDRPAGRRLHAGERNTVVRRRRENEDDYRHDHRRSTR